MANKVMEKLHSFVLEPAPQERRSWITWPMKSWRASTIPPQTDISRWEKLNHTANEFTEDLNTFFLKLTPQVRMASEVMENLDTFFLKLASQIRRRWSTLNEVMKNLHSFFLKLATQLVRKSWSTRPIRSLRTSSHHILPQTSDLGKEKLEPMVNKAIENLNTFFFKQAPQVRSKVGSLAQCGHGEPLHILPQTSASGKEKMEHTAKEVMKNLDAFFLVLAT
jgi:hypothetical protein